MPEETKNDKPGVVSSSSSPTPAFKDGPRLLADVGGTNARFALERRPGAIGDIFVYAGNDYPGIAEAIQQFYKDAGISSSDPVRHAVIAIANPIDGDQVSMTNHNWHFSIEATRRALQLETLKVVNDFAALALAVPALGESQRQQVGGGEAREDSALAVLGAGTGLGVAGLINIDGRWHALPTEGGHASFSPLDEREDRILAAARLKWGHVSFERLASGPGIELIYSVLAAENTALAAGSSGSDELDTAGIVGSAEKGDALALETIDIFCAVLGSFAGNVALTFGAQGGVYIGGGVVPKLGKLFYASRFRERFEQKGRFDRYLSNIPTYVIVAENPAFIGASEILTATLAR